MKVWEGSKEIIHTKPKNKQSINSLGLNGTLCTEQNKIANSLNQLFVTYLKKLKKKKKKKKNIKKKNKKKFFKNIKKKSKKKKKKKIIVIITSNKDFSHYLKDPGKNMF